jgi:hypothetical protein
MLVQRVLHLNADQWTGAVQQIFEHLNLLDTVVDKADHEVRSINDRLSMTGPAFCTNHSNIVLYITLKLVC